MNFERFLQLDQMNSEKVTIPSNLNNILQIRIELTLKIDVAKILHISN